MVNNPTYIDEDAKIVGLDGISDQNDNDVKNVEVENSDMETITTKLQDWDMIATVKLKEWNHTKKCIYQD